MSDTTYVLELTTEVEPAAQFTIDGDAFELLGFEHLTPTQEAEVIADLSRYESLQTQLELSNDDKESVSIAKKLRAKRISILARLTTAPKDTISKLPLPAQVRLIQTVQDNARPADPSEE